MSMTMIEQLRELRRLSGLTQGELAQKAGLTRMAVQRIESNTSDPRLSTVQCLARALGLEVMLVPKALKPELLAFAASGGRFLGQPPGVSAPLSVVDTLRDKIKKKRR